MIVERVPDDGEVKGPMSSSMCPTAAQLLGQLDVSKAGRLTGDDDLWKSDAWIGGRGEAVLCKLDVGDWPRIYPTWAGHVGRAQIDQMGKSTHHPSHTD